MKFFKVKVKAMLLASLFLVFTSCTGLVSQQDKNKIGSKNSENAEGGITSGGGGVIAADVLTRDEFYQILIKAKAELRLYLNQKNRDYYSNLEYRESRPSSIKETDQFYVGEKSLSSVLEKIELETQDEKPCYDELGNEVDASYVKSKPNSICLSIFRLKSKLDKDNVHSGVYSLLIHEISHSIGATEEQALVLQKEAADVFTQNPGSILSPSTKLLPLLYTRNLFVKTLSELDSDDLSKTKKHLEKAFTDYHYAYYSFDSDYNGRSVFDRKAYDLYSDIYELMVIIQTYIDISVPPFYGQQEAIDRYNEIFKDQSKIYITKSGRKISKIENLKDLKKSFNIAINYFNEIRLYATGLAFNNPIPQFLAMSENFPVNPWARFAGRYRITSSTENCSDIPGGMGQHTTMEITVDSNNPHEVFVARNGLASIVKEPYFTNGNVSYSYFSYFSNFYPVINVYGESGTPFRTLEIGSKWPSSLSASLKYSKITETMALKDLDKPNRFEFKIVQETYKFKPNGLSESNTKECVMTLTLVNVINQ